MRIQKMTDYNFDHSDITQVQIQHLKSNPLEACQRENASLHIRLETFNRMLLEAKEESETRLNRIKQVRHERDAAFNEGENYARREVEAEMGILRKGRHDAEMKSKKLEENEAKTQEMMKELELELENLRMGAGAVEGVDVGLMNSLREERDRYEEELNEAKEIIMGKELHIQHLKEETRSMSVNAVDTPPVESARIQALTDQLYVLMAERDGIRQQLEIVTENLMGGTPTKLTPKEDKPQTTLGKDKEPAIKSFSLSTDPKNADFHGTRKRLHAPSPLRQSTTPESEEDESDGQGENKENEKVDERLKQSIETDENDAVVMGDYPDDGEFLSQRLLINQIKKLEKRNMRLERCHDKSHVIRAILSLTPVHFEAFRQRKESKRKEDLVLLDIMSKECNALRNQIRKFEKQLQLLADLRRKKREEDTGDAQDFILMQDRYDAKEEDTKSYRILYETAEQAMKNMIKAGANLDANEVIELRKERDILVKRKEELEEEIDGPLGLREQLAFSIAEDTEDIDMATQLTRVKAELELRTKERDAAIEESKVEENLTSIKELMDQLSKNLEADIYRIEEKDEQDKEVAKRYRQCQRELSDEKERVKSLEKFLEDKYMEYEDLAGDVHDDSLSARLARTLIELYQTKRKLMERTIQRNSLIKSAVGYLAAVLRENETLQQKIYILQKHPNRDPRLPIRDIDLENEETIIKLRKEISFVTTQFHQAGCEVYSAKKKAKRAKERLDQYIEMSAFGRDSHPRVQALRHDRDRSPIDPNATDPEVIEHLKTQLKDADDLMDLIVARYSVWENGKGGLNPESMEVAERRLEECMDLVHGPLGQKEAYDNLKALLTESREVLKVKMNEWNEKDKERDWAVESLEKLLKESEEREAALAKLLYSTQEDMKREGTRAAKVVEMEEQLTRNEQRIRDLLREKDEHKAEADGLESFLRASETQMTQLEEQISRGEEKLRDLQQESDNQKAEAEVLEDLLKASEIKIAESFRTLRDEEEKKYRGEIERLQEVLLLKEEEDEQFREEIERLHELHTASEGKVTELLDMSLKTSKRLSDLEAEITRWKIVAGESIRKTEELQQESEDSQSEVKLLRITNNQNEETQTEEPIFAGMETQTDIDKIPQSTVPTSTSPPIPTVPALKSKNPKKKAFQKKPITKEPRDLRYHPSKDAGSEPSDEELETPKAPKPQLKRNISLQQETARPALSPSPAPSLTIKLKSKAHSTKNKGKREERGQHNPAYKNDTGAESEDEEIPPAEVVQESPVEEKMEVDGPRRSRRTRNPNPVYTGELVVEGLGVGQKRKADGRGNKENGKKRKAVEGGAIGKEKRGKK
ncbi:ccbe0aa9-fa31-43f6-a54b-f50995e2f0c7-CDS [Sclerotinia trifoliorum]|uniref:Ccbe0aa9-fa31-43f6-a54b-f50995e2f0c7-CDS n=1 Tax=Sclerotinia trifoliorum TaxID=28548 RepID=A0A8H2ZQ27_9HELO|nr:ccbe0aa9-fa31-43f6-a54b-f50995e2f0c7-CDS [Sclerotinia trifoliorum]